MSGCVIWFTGLSGAGKTTLAVALRHYLAAHGQRVELLDGDVLRQGLCADLGFSPADRDENIRRVTYVAKYLSRQGVATLCAFVSPYRAARDFARRETTNFVEVYVACSLAECMRRDPKGLYARDVPDLTGVTAPYEAPLDPEVVVHTDRSNVPECIDWIVGYMEERGLIDG